MNKNFSIPNPFANMKPWVKATFIICVTLIIIASMFWGYFDDILSLFKD